VLLTRVPRLNLYQISSEVGSSSEVSTRYACCVALYTHAGVLYDHKYVIAMLDLPHVEPLLVSASCSTLENDGVAASSLSMDDGTSLSRSATSRPRRRRL